MKTENPTQATSNPTHHHIIDLHGSRKNLCPPPLLPILIPQAAGMLAYYMLRLRLRLTKTRTASPGHRKFGKSINIKMFLEKCVKQYPVGGPGWSNVSL